MKLPAYFKEPDINNPDDMYKILTVGNNAGGLTPNKAKEIIYSLLGDNYEPFDEEWGDIPLAYAKTQQTANFPDLAAQLEKQIKKAAGAQDDAIVAVMKEVRSLLVKMSEEAK